MRLVTPPEEARLVAAKPGERVGTGCVLDERRGQSNLVGALDVLGLADLHAKHVVRILVDNFDHLVKG